MGALESEPRPWAPGQAVGLGRSPGPGDTCPLGRTPSLTLGPHALPESSLEQLEAAASGSPITGSCWRPAGDLEPCLHQHPPTDPHCQVHLTAPTSQSNGVIGDAGETWSQALWPPACSAGPSRPCPWPVCAPYTSPGDLPSSDRSANTHAAGDVAPQGGIPSCTASKPGPEWAVGACLPALL